MKIPAPAAAVLALCLAVSVVLTDPRSRNAEFAEKSVIAMGTMVRIKVPLTEGISRRIADGGIGGAIDEIRRVERLFSAFSADSEISRINATGKGRSVKVQPEVFDLIVRAVKFSESTGGAFDITVKPLVDLWSAARKDLRVPSETEIRAALEKVGFRNLILDKAAGTLIFAKDGMAIDMAGIAKGYAADRAAKTLLDHGIANAVVDCGGDMRCIGRRSKPDRWRVAVRHPRQKGSTFLQLELEDAAIDTSGDYERFFTVEGRRYSHIIDPRTGYPVGDDIVSASVIAADSVTADALATAICVLGLEGSRSARSADGISAVVVYVDNGRLKADIPDGFMERYAAVETAGL